MSNITNIIIANICARPEFRYADARLIADVVRITAAAICGPTPDTDTMAEEIAAAARHDAAALRQHDTKGDR